jgi:hypothetical protein
LYKRQGVEQANAAPIRWALTLLASISVDFKDSLVPNIPAYLSRALVRKISFLTFIVKIVILLCSIKDIFWGTPTLTIMTFSIMALSILTVSIITLSITIGIT